MCIHGFQIEALLMQIVFCPLFCFFLRFKGCKKRDDPSPSLSPHITPLPPGLKASLFQRKRLHTKGKRGRKKNHPAFCVFLSNGSCLSHCLPHSHPYTLRAVAMSKSTAKYHMGPPPLSSPPNPTHPLPTRVSE